MIDMETWYRGEFIDSAFKLQTNQPNPIIVWNSEKESSLPQN